MLKSNSLYLLAFAVLLFLLNLTLLFLLFNEKKVRSTALLEHDLAIINLQHRLAESARIAFNFTGKPVMAFSDAVSGSGERLDAGAVDSLRSSYILAISGNTCSSCIPEAFSILRELEGDFDPSRLYVIGEFSSPQVMFQAMRSKDIPAEIGIFSPGLARYLTGLENIPVLMKVGEDLRVERVCLVDKHMPLDYYRRFFGR